VITTLVRADSVASLVRVTPILALAASRRLGDALAPLFELEAQEQALSHEIQLSSAR
jgi:hypothetical protein